MNEATAIRPEAKAQRLLDKSYQQTKPLGCEASLINSKAKRKGFGEVADEKVDAKSKSLYYGVCTFPQWTEVHIYTPKPKTPN